MLMSFSNIFIPSLCGRVYCKYHYLEGHEFKTPESELRHFLGKMVQPDWKWADQYDGDFEQEKEETGITIV